MQVEVNRIHALRQRLLQVLQEVASDALKSVLRGQVGVTCDKYLSHDWLDFFGCISNIAIVTRYITPRQQGLLFFVNNTLDDGFAGFATIFALR